MTLAKQLYIIIAIIFFIIFSGNFIISTKNMKEYLEVESSIKAQDTATSLGMSLRPLIKNKEDPEIVSVIKAISNSGFYKEIRLEDASFTIDSSKFLNELHTDYKISSVRVDSKYGKIEKIELDSELNDELLKLENGDLDLDSKNHEEEQKYRFIPTKNYQKGGEIPFTVQLKDNNKTITKIVKIEMQKVLVKETRAIKFEYIPKWFIELIPISLEEKYSEISDGWTINAIIYVSPNPGEAYAKLYEQAKNSIIYALIAFLISMVSLFVFVQFMLRPLKKIEKLAKDIAQAKFSTIEPLPWTTEIKNVAIAMNDMSRKIESTITRLTKNLEKISTKLSKDCLTGLDLKQTFDTDIKDMFIKKERGFVYKIKVDSLSYFAKKHTNEEIDKYLLKITNILNSVCIDNSNLTAYRVYGSEFILLARSSKEEMAKEIAINLKNSFESIAKEFDLEEIAHIGVTSFDELSSLDEIMQASNEAYQKAKLIGPNEFFLNSTSNQSRNMNEWRDLISEIIFKSKFEIDFINSAYTLNESNELFMEEAFTKATDNENNQIPIGTFVSLAEKYEKIVDFDKAVIQKIINYINSNNIKHKICINLSIESISKNDFIIWLQNELTKNKTISSNLVFSLTAYSVAKDLNNFKNFCDYIHSCGGKIIIKRFESKFIPIENLKEFNIDYIRLAKDYTVNINESISKKEFIESINDLANLLNIKIFAESVKEDKDYKILKKIKIFGASK